MHRFYVESQCLKKGSCFEMSGKEARHAFFTLRLKINDPVVLFDGNGNEYKGIVASVSRKAGVIEVREALVVPADTTKIVLAAAIPKNSKFDDIVDKATQLGVHAVIPMQTQRMIVSIEPQRAMLKQKRWQRIAVEACKQSGCSYIPRIEPVTYFERVLKNSNSFDLRLIASLRNDARQLKDVIRKSSPQNVIVFIGPEGDFSEEEYRMAQEQGLMGVSLGKNILKCETAVIMTLSVMHYEWKL
ncbi:MAG: 16S rRNA (uracil(1498)-N(3))-methyltransferase [Candidatus Omnitrophica bacterium]|nr:16S rRNA (uracil(1498)-N(3))-methyltransferase [Candidatus Omnitrophota bacterium]MBU4478510.1 16S rRNA (uracil(1498)-N(3))-methyltransferase [Candidatus Omnitrophota bacterium]MCG2703691.1 16S rRNA (uracil(1498)-N(3))-methyltransferase [Candidatus Omnitrophota bacterium]